MQKYKIQGYKKQDTNKFQIPIIKQFDYWNLEFVWLLYLVSLYLSL